jgi:hypothetical protein
MNFIVCPEVGSQFPERKLIQDKKSIIHTGLGVLPQTYQGRWDGRRLRLTSPPILLHGTSPSAKV